MRKWKSKEVTFFWQRQLLSERPGVKFVFFQTWGLKIECCAAFNPFCDLDLSHPMTSPCFSIARMELFSVDYKVEPSAINTGKHFENYKCTIKIWGFIIGCFSTLGIMQKKSLIPCGDRKHCRILQSCNLVSLQRVKFKTYREHLFFPFVLTRLSHFNNLWHNV